MAVLIYHASWGTDNGTCMLSVENKKAFDTTLLENQKGTSAIEFEQSSIVPFWFSMVYSETALLCRFMWPVCASEVAPGQNAPPGSWEGALWLFAHDGKVRILNFNSKCAFWITQCTHERRNCDIWITQCTHERPNLGFWIPAGEECLGTLPIKHAWRSHFLWFCTYAERGI